MDSTGSEELSLRDVYQVLKRHVRLIVGLPVAAAVVTLGASMLLPKSYSSRAIYNLSVQNPAEGTSVFPTAQALAQGFSSSLSTSAQTALLGNEDPQQLYKSSFDDKQNLWTLTGKGDSPTAARLATEKLVVSAKRYINDQLVGIARQNQAATLELAKIQLQDARDQLRRVEPLLKQAQVSGNAAVVAAALQGEQGSSGQSRINSPAVSLALQVNTLRVNIASLESRIASAQRLLADPQELRDSLGQAIMLRAILAPGDPLEADFPRPLLFTALAVVLGFLVAVVLAFVLEALRDPEPRSSTVIVPNPAD
jgi:LPS O-antigen subunit length determinant protein (WzzB/FepE family)